jgi:predicted tellurium resistance membrane protein TerC
MYLRKKTTHKETKQSGFWPTVLKVELADIAFAVDSILAAVALAVTLPGTSLPKIGGLDGGQFLVILAGGIIGLVIMRFAASPICELVKGTSKPRNSCLSDCRLGRCEACALYARTSRHSGIVSEHFIHSGTWKLIFWGVLAAIAVGGWFMSGGKKHPRAHKRTRITAPVNGRTASERLCLSKAESFFARGRADFRSSEIR